MYLNTQDAGELFLLVSAVGRPSTDAGFRLEVRFAPEPPLGDTCGTAQPLSVPSRLANQTTVGLAKDYFTLDGCAEGGPERVYVVEIPAGRTLVAEVNGDHDAVINASAVPAWGCDQFCWASSDSTDGGSETMRFVNGEGLPLRLYLRVARKLAGSLNYSLDVRFEE